MELGLFSRRPEHRINQQEVWVESLSLFVPFSKLLSKIYSYHQPKYKDDELEGLETQVKRSIKYGVGKLRRIKRNRHAIFTRIS